MLHVYYNKEKIKEGKLWFVTSTDHKLDVTPDNSVLYVSDTPFTGYPILVPAIGGMYETIRKANDRELVELGKRLLKDNEEIDGDHIVIKKPTIDEIRDNVTINLNNIWYQIERQPSRLNGIDWYGGYDSAQKLDAVRRIAIENNQPYVDFFDVKDVKHRLDLETAKIVTTFVATVYEVGFTAYKQLIVELRNTEIEQEMYDILEKSSVYIANSITEFFAQLMGDGNG